MKRIDLEEIAYENGLTYIETAYERHKSPFNIEHAIIGFDNFEEAQELAEKHCLSIEEFIKRDGWSIWWQTGRRMNEAFCMDSIMAERDDVDIFTDKKQFFDDYVRRRLAECDNYEDWRELTAKLEEIAEKIEEIETDEIVIARDGEFRSVVPAKCMRYHDDDVTERVIGLIDHNDYLDEEED